MWWDSHEEVDVGEGLGRDVSMPVADAWESSMSALTKRGKFVGTGGHFSMQT